MQLLQPPATSSLLEPNILSTLFSNIPKLCSSLSTNDQVSLPHEKTGKIMALNILILSSYRRYGKATDSEW
jgi:hypothetical protein